MKCRKDQLKVTSVRKHGCIVSDDGFKRRKESQVHQTDTGQEMTLSSSMTLTTRKTKYSINMMKPSSLLMRHLQAAMETMTKSSMRKRSTMAQNRPLELTCTGFMLLRKDQRSQGNGSLQTHENTDQVTSHNSCQ